MYKKILSIIVAFFICTSVTFADIKGDIEKVENTGDSIYLLLLSALKEDDPNIIEKETKFIKTQISEKKEALLSDKNTTKSDSKKINDLVLLGILNYYEISIIELQNYYENNKDQSFISAVASYNEADTILETLKARILSNI